MCPKLRSDMNGDGVQTISDLWLWVKGLYFWPGNWLIEQLARNPKMMEFFELNWQSCGGWLSLAISTLCWVFLWIMLAAITSIGER